MIKTVSLSTAKLLKEEWLTIYGYEGLYQISNYGNVRRVHKRGTFKILKVCYNKGYAQVSLSKNNKWITKRIARLVATHFIDNPYLKTQVNHIDGDKTNNHISNLEWCSPSENTYHAHRVLKVGNDSKGENNPSSKLKAHEIRNMRDLHNNGLSIISIAIRYGISHQHCSDIINKKKWKHI